MRDDIRHASRDVTRHESQTRAAQYLCAKVIVGIFLPTAREFTSGKWTELPTQPRHRPVLDSTTPTAKRPGQTEVEKTCYTTHQTINIFNATYPLLPRCLPGREGEGEVPGGLRRLWTAYLCGSISRLNSVGYLCKFCISQAHHDKLERFNCYWYHLASPQRPSVIGGPVTCRRLLQCDV